METIFLETKTGSLLVTVLGIKHTLINILDPPLPGWALGVFSNYPESQFLHPQNEPINTHFVVLPRLNSQYRVCM